MRKRAIAVVLGAVILLAAGVGGWFWARSTALRTPSMSYSLENTYKVIVPEDDSELQTWLESLPGYRTGDLSRSGQKVSIHFELGDPQPPDVLGAVLKQSEALGYREPTGYSGRFGRKKAFDFHTLRVEYKTMPADDRVLLDWLGKNPGLRSAKVARDGRVISMELVSTDPPVPTILGDIMQYCRSVGYADQVGYSSGFGPYR